MIFPIPEDMLPQKLQTPHIGYNIITPILYAQGRTIERVLQELKRGIKKKKKGRDGRGKRGKLWIIFFSYCNSIYTFSIYTSYYVRCHCVVRYLLLVFSISYLKFVQLV